MARGSNEHRMVFDIRGRRRHVVKFVYAILALLMVASLFLVTGAVNLNSILGTGTTGESATSSLEKQAEHIEAKLAKTPEDEALLANLARTRVNVANTMISTGVESQSGEEEIRQQLALASEDWSKYLAVAEEPSAGLATQVSPALYNLARLSSNNAEVVENLALAAEAEEIIVKARPSLNSWSTLAFYRLYAQDYAGAAEAKEKALPLAGTKFARENFENEFEKVEKQAKELSKAVKAEKTSKGNGAGKESLENPLGGLGGSSLSGE
jgi:predicted ATP-grasp superfamily ATP-dependent carboligase